MQSIDDSFVHPPLSSRPWVNWFWVDGNITREGITADLEAMQRVGIGGALLMDVSQEVPPGPVRFGTPPWYELFKHTAAEAQRLGLELSMHNAPGWCGSGGPWITPELGMQKLVWNSTNLVGPLSFNSRLPPLQRVQGFSKDIAVLAFPALVGDGARLPGFAPKLTASASEGFDGARLLDGDPSTATALVWPASAKPQFIQLEFTNAFLAAQLKLLGTSRNQTFEGELQASDDGRSFSSLRPFRAREGSVSLQFEPHRSRFFRLLFKRADPNRLEFSELDLVPIYRIPSHQAKAGMGPWTPPEGPIPDVPPYAAIRPDTIINLTTNVTEDGRLQWQVPEGQWTVVRFGYTPTGMPNHPIGQEGSGLECDKLSRQAIEAHFAAFLAKLISEVGDAAGRSFVATHIDSWEIGYQNWTARFREEFQQRRGYDLLPYLPTLTGRYVDSASVSERFLWDMRRTIADLLADNYAGGLAQLAHQHHMQLSIEAYANGPFDSLLYAGRADLPMSEFWNERDDFSRFYRTWVMASAAHTYGRQIVPAEAFTSYPVCAKWQNHPFSLKAMGDAAFCEGVNRMVFHRYAHQPWLNRQPGMTMGPWGVHYERTETWWEQSKPWHEYLARCQFLLQQGLFAADICYLTDEGAFVEPPTLEKLQPAPPAGYRCDVATPEVLITRMSFQSNRLILPDGMNYRLLVLPPTKTMSPKLLRKLKQLVEAGATVVGTRPVEAPGLENHPQSDLEVRQLAAELWGDADGYKSFEHPFGKGRLLCGRPLEAVLQELRLAPDFETLSPHSGVPLRWIHRSIGTSEFYFVANSNSQPVTVECAFRVTGKRPEFWHPDDGRREFAPIWQSQTNTTRMTISLEPCGSVFVVFAQDSQGVDPIISMTPASQPVNLLQFQGGGMELHPSKTGPYDFVAASGKRYHADVPEIAKPLELTGPWEVRFPPGSGAPSPLVLNRLSSWTESSDAAVKYFSGTAVYSLSFQIPSGWLDTNKLLLLDLGNVQVIAETKLNGKKLGTLWKPPFEADVTPMASAGMNALELNVVNLWPNRIIGDEQLPEDCRWAVTQGDNGSPLVDWPKWFLEGKPSPTGRTTFSTWKHWHKSDALLPSGLLGPVRLRCVPRVRIF